MDDQYADYFCRSFLADGPDMAFEIFRQVYDMHRGFFHLSSDEIALFQLTLNNIKHIRDQELWLLYYHWDYQLFSI